jgi:hypothetical protein
MKVRESRRGGVLVAPSMLLLFVLAFVLPISTAAHHPCACINKTSDHRYQGGDKTPLTWYSIQRLEHPGTGSSEPQYCYERKVTNHSKVEVRDVLWSVAGYWNRVLPPATEDCCCQALALAGSLAIPHPQGPIHYGTGSRTQYSTTAYAPKAGWPAATASFTPLRDVSSPPPLGGTFEVALPSPSGGYDIVTVVLRSFVSRMEGGTEFEYTYEFANMGRAPVRVFWDVPRSDDFQRQFYLDQNEPLSVNAGAKQTRQVKSKEPPTEAITAVFIRDSKGDVVSRGIASVYGFASGKTTLRHAVDWPDAPR